MPQRQGRIIRRASHAIEVLPQRLEAALAGLGHRERGKALAVLEAAGRRPTVKGTRKRSPEANAAARWLTEREIVIDSPWQRLRRGSLGWLAREARIKRRAVLQARRARRVQARRRHTEAEADRRRGKHQLEPTVFGTLHAKRKRRLRGRGRNEQGYTSDTISGMTKSARRAIRRKYRGEGPKVTE